VLYPAEDHLVFATQNDFAPATSQLGHMERVHNPGSFTFSWYPDLDSPSLGIGPTVSVGSSTRAERPAERTCNGRPDGRYERRAAMFSLE
jgi:hypothetical protein